MATRLLFPLLAALAPGPAPAQALGPDAAACAPDGGPAIRIDVGGLKDRSGSVKAELYPANEADFLKGDRDLIGAGKTFRRVQVRTPAAGPVALCIRAPRPGPYALFVTHDRDGKNKFNVWADGAGLVDPAPIRRAKPKVAQALVTAGAGTVVVAVRLQYLQGFPPSFGPLKGR